MKSVRKLAPAPARLSLAAIVTLTLPCPALPADLADKSGQFPAPAYSTGKFKSFLNISGRAAVIDGRTLWFPSEGYKVRLASIDTCDVPQWSYDPHQYGESKLLKPVPCGPLAKAWLKRLVGNDQVTCAVQMQHLADVLVGRCLVRSRDLALGLLRVGWAHATSPAPAEYLRSQNNAVAAGYGMWTTYVLSPHEWRRKAIDSTLSRRPIADFNLLAERESEMSPPFDAARMRQKRTDR